MTRRPPMTYPSEAPLDLLIVEDHDQFRTNLEFVLGSESGLRCRAVPNAEEALTAMANYDADLVLMDINLPGRSGIECTRAIRKKWPKTQVLICTVFDDDEKIFSALQAGACGYLLKRSPVKEIIEGIRLVQQGGAPMSPAIARRVVHSFHVKPLENGQRLSLREQEVLDLLSRGMRAQEIADKIFVSLATVKSHIHHIYEKLHVQNRVELLNRTRNGMV